MLGERRRLLRGGEGGDGSGGAHMWNAPVCLRVARCPSIDSTITPARIIISQRFAVCLLQTRAAAATSIANPISSQGNETGRRLAVCYGEEGKNTHIAQVAGGGWGMEHGGLKVI